MNPNGEYKGKTYDYGRNKDGWPASQMKTFIDNDIYNSLPNELKSVIITTETVSGHGSEDTNNFTSSDKLYLLAPKEIYDGWSSQYDTGKDKTRLLDYYKNIGVTTSNYGGAIKKNNGSNNLWWLRLAVSNNSYYFFIITETGYLSTTRANNTDGVSPAFRIG